jgi:hypothetical protein
VTTGIAGSSASASYNDEYGDFDYSASLWRSGCDGCANRLLVRGSPDPLDAGNHWYAAYVFQYTRSGSYSIFREQAGTAYMIQDWTPSAAINQGSAWNTLRVVADGAYLEFYINGVQVWSGSDGSLSLGQVGLSMYRSATSTGDEFRVDWATLSLLGTTTRSGAGIAPRAMGVLLPEEEAYRMNHAPPGE